MTLAFITFINLTEFAYGQDILNERYVDFKRTEAYEYSIHGGAFLPFGIPGVRSNYSFWGLRFSHPIRYNMLDWGIMNGRGDGVIYYNFHLSIRLDLSIVDSVNGFIYFGPDLNYYQRKADVQQTFPFIATPGFHGGGGVEGSIGGPLFMRAEFKFGANPGSSLYAGVGLVIKSFSGEQEKE
jgi:hypothetical protein